MIGSKLPQNLLSGLALGVGVGAIMLALFYGQYQWLANELVLEYVGSNPARSKKSFVLDDGLHFTQHLYLHFSQ